MRDVEKMHVLDKVGKFDSEQNFWPVAYNICFKSMQENKLIWFQNRIIKNILDTNYYMNKTTTHANYVIILQKLYVIKQ